MQVVIPIYMDRDAHILVFISVFCLLTGLIGCIPSGISFSPAWLVLVIYVAVVPMIVDLFETIGHSRRTGDKIMHSHWIDALTPDAPSALPRRIRRMKQVNHGPVWTCCQLALGILFTAMGIVYRSNHNRRVMAVFGLFWILELGVRWCIELAYNYYWELNKEHPLLAEILQDSTLTRWCKSVYRWLTQMAMVHRSEPASQNANVRQAFLNITRET